MSRGSVGFAKKISWVVLGGLMFAQTAAFADTIEGRVAQTGSRELAMVAYDAQGRPYPNQLNLKIDTGTEFQGVSSAGQLQPNDAIRAEVRQEPSGIWRADRVMLFEQPDARPATQHVSSPLQDMLGNPVVRGALLGAATGAIASGASGGKAGKGALVGMGAGAAAGLLQGLFESRSDKQPDSDNR